MPPWKLLLFVCFEKHLSSSDWETSPVIPRCHTVVGATHGKKYWHLWNLEVSCTHFPVSKTSINFHFQTWVFWEWLHCETRALFFSICRGGVTFPAVSDGPNSVRCWMLCSVCWNVHWESQPHTTVSSEQLTSVWCLLRWKKANTVLFIFPEQQQASTSSCVGLWDGGQVKQLYSILGDADGFL